MQPETRFQYALRKKLEKIPKSYWIKIQMVAVRGIPDFIGVINGRLIALELKIEGNSASGLQSYTLRKLALAGAWTRVVYPRDVEKLLEDLQELSVT